jgi:GTP pyrophosphokinase
MKTDSSTAPTPDAQAMPVAGAAGENSSLVDKAQGFALPLLSGQHLPTGESLWVHAHAVVDLVAGIGGTPDMQAAVYLAYACDQLNKPQELVAAAFGEELAHLAVEAQRLFQLQRQARQQREDPLQTKLQIENVRRMLLAFSRDLRVVMLLLASHLQTLRYTSGLKVSGFEAIARESLQVFAPLANRLGVWQIKWEMEDLAFRMLEPSVYKEVAQLLEIKRSDREQEIAQLQLHLQTQLKQQGINAQVQGRPKNIYSIVKKMRGKSLGFDQVRDLRAFRIIVSHVDDCYRALSLVHAHMLPLDNEFDDYIAKPKANGYQSLHTVVRHEGQVLEIQIRTHDMHEHAEFGVAAHWAYKEAGVKGYAGVSASVDQAHKMAVLRQLLAWERDLAGAPQAPTAQEDDKIYVLTPEAAIVELPLGATPIDFAYTLHTQLGHRCRGAKLDGVLVPLNTALRNGQTVEITAIKEGGPSRDWLNPELGFLASGRAKAKVRAWFNAQKAAQTMARGRDLVEKLLQREGRTAFKLEDLAKQLGFDSAAHLFEVVGKDEFSLRHIELLLRPAAPPEPVDERLLRKVQRPKALNTPGGVLVVGVDSLLTQLARCCRPAPPDDIKGFVTRGKGISVHRVECRNFLQLVQRSPDRVIDVAWGATETTAGNSVYPVDVQVLAHDRQGLLRDISEVFAKEKMNVIGVQTQSIKEVAWMTFTIEVPDASRLTKVLGIVKTVSGVQSARRLAA